MKENPPKPYDSGSKRLLAISAQALLDLFAPGLRFTGQFSEQFHSDEIEADAMIETFDANNQQEMVHFEFQSGPDTHMEERLLDYSTRAYRRYKCPIRSYVLYLRDCGVPTPPLIHKYADGEPYHWFNYKVVEVAKIPHRTILDQDRQGLFPLVPLMQGGARREVIEEIITRYLPADDTITRERLALTRLFASLACNQSDKKIQEWIDRRFAMLQDLFQDTYIYKRDVAVGREKAREEERQALQDLFMSTIQARFPRLNNLARKQLELIADVTVLRTLAKQVSAASTQKEVKTYLLSWQQSEQHD